MKKHKNIPIFIPHMGCPNNCVFCNQKVISGTQKFDINSVPSLVYEALSTIDQNKYEVQLAYFGGSFTGIDRADMLYLLSFGKKLIDEGKISSVRCSTRPDYIDDDILKLLDEYGVKSIELGIQSTNDDVLIASGRGHTHNDTVKACKLIKEYRKFELVGQMMTSLPGSSWDKDIKTAEDICKLGCDSARIYPTMTFKNTELENMMKRGIYCPPTLEETVSNVWKILDIFIKNNINVIRIGLAEGDGLHGLEGIISDNYSPAMGELIIGEYYKNLICNLIDSANRSEKLTIYAHKGHTSKIIGNKGCNKIYIADKYNIKYIKVVEKDDILLYNCKIEFN